MLSWLSSRLTGSHCHFNWSPDKMNQSASQLESNPINYAAFYWVTRSQHRERRLSVAIITDATQCLNCNSILVTDGTPLLPTTGRCQSGDNCNKPLVIGASEMHQHFLKITASVPTEAAGKSSVTRSIFSVSIL